MKTNEMFIKEINRVSNRLVKLKNRKFIPEFIKTLIAGDIIDFFISYISKQLYYRPLDYEFARTLFRLYYKSNHFMKYALPNIKMHQNGKNIILKPMTISDHLHMKQLSYSSYTWTSDNRIIYERHVEVGESNVSYGYDFSDDDHIYTVTGDNSVYLDNMIQEILKYLSLYMKLAYKNGEICNAKNIYEDR